MLDDDQNPSDWCNYKVRQADIIPQSEDPRYGTRLRRPDGLGAGALECHLPSHPPSMSWNLLISLVDK
jgi:hypothetical protein